MEDTKIPRAKYEELLKSKGFVNGRVKKGTYGRRYFSAVHKPSGEVTTFEVDDKDAADAKDILAILAWIRLL